MRINFKIVQKSGRDRFSRFVGEGGKTNNNLVSDK